MSQIAPTATRSEANPTTPATPSDAALLEEVAALLTPPRREPADSFVLHAPLELIARSALLPYVRPSARGDARRRVVELGDGYRTASPPAAEPRAQSFDDPAAAAAALVRAIDEGELDDVDAAARWLGQNTSARELRGLLAPSVVPRLGAAAHAPIFLFQLPRVAPRGQITPELLRGLVRELARVPDWRLHWLDDRSAGTSPDPRPEALWDALAAVPASRAVGERLHLPLDVADRCRRSRGRLARDRDDGRSRRTRSVASVSRPGRAARRRVVDAARAARSRALRMEPLPHDAASRLGHRACTPRSRRRPSRWRAPTSRASAPRSRAGR